MKWKKWFCAALSAWMIFGIGAGQVGAEEAARTEIQNGQTEEAAQTEIQNGAAEEEQPATAGRADEEETTEQPGIEERGLELGESSIAYPAVTGMGNEELEKAVNDRILEDTGVTGYLTRMSQLLSGGKLEVRWRGGILGDVFSCAVSAEGAVTSPRNAFVWTWSNIDLRNGEEILWEDLFTDPETARENLEAWMEEEIAPELSAHLLNGNVTPMPEGFQLNQRGIVLLYTTEQWSTLSDRAGDLLIGWNEAEDALDLSEGSAAQRAGAGDMLALTEESLMRLQEITEEGFIPGLPLRLGDSIRDAVNEWHLLIDPDLYESGRMFSLEGGLFRDVFLLTDFLSESWEESRVDGIRLDSGCLYGLRIGQTTEAEWHLTLGEPDATVFFDEEKAEAYRTVTGNRDYYTWGAHTLMLHSDENGILTSIILEE